MSKLELLKAAAEIFGREFSQQAWLLIEEMFFDVDAVDLKQSCIFHVRHRAELDFSSIYKYSKESKNVDG